MIILGNLFSLMGSICSFLSTRAKTYKNTLLIQSLDATLFTLSCLCLGGYSGVVVNSCAVARNLSCAFFKLNLYVKIAFISVTVVLGIVFMEKTWYGILPIIASSYYSIIMLTTKDVIKLKRGLLVNNLLWMIYEIIILDFMGVLFKIASFISCKQSISNNKLEVNKDGEYNNTENTAI